MNSNYIFVFAVGIGIVAGLRSMTAPAVVSWAAYLGWLSLEGWQFAFMGSIAAVATFSLLAIHRRARRFDRDRPGLVPGLTIARQL
jgi:uncharacterized membrane protein